MEKSLRLSEATQEGGSNKVRTTKEAVKNIRLQLDSSRLVGEDVSSTSAGEVLQETDSDVEVSNAKEVHTNTEVIQLG